MPERILVTGVLGCLGAWTARAALADGDEWSATTSARTDARLRLVLGADSERVTLVRGRHHRARGARADARRARDHERRPPRGAPGAVRAGEPAARDARQRRRHGQRLRGRLTPPRPHPGDRLRELDRGVQRLRSLPRARDAAGRRRAPSTASRSSPTRASRGSTRPSGAALGRAAPVRRLRPRPGPGDDLRPDRGDARGRPRRAVRDRLHGHARSTTTRRTSLARFSLQPTTRAAAQPSTTRRASPRRSRSSSRRSAPSCPDAELTWAGEPLPFPAELEAVGFDRDVGTFPRTPLAEGIAATIAHFRAAA